MSKNPACCTADKSLQEVAQMMVEHDCGCIPVVEDMQTMAPIGMITDRDITVRTVARGSNPLDLTAGDAMTGDVVCVTPEMSVEECCNLMENKQIRRVAVIDENGSCCGMVAQADIAIKAPTDKTAEVVQEVSRTANI
jgi:CBS domain-containing protein